jgi:hypothetical protein
VIIDGRRIEWNDLGAMLLAFEGWQFRLEMLDRRASSKTHAPSLAELV